MKRIQSFLLALVFVSLLSVSVPAGHIESGAVPEPTPAAAMVEENEPSWLIDLVRSVWITYLLPFSR